jgi:hypothetical protein
VHHQGGGWPDEQKPRADADLSHASISECKPRYAAGTTCRAGLRSDADVSPPPPGPVRVTAILARGVMCPQGQEPLHWLLLTNVPVASAADAARCLRWYACRWRSERFRLVLQSGCKVEELQLAEAVRLGRLLHRGLALATARHHLCGTGAPGVALHPFSLPRCVACLGPLRQPHGDPAQHPARPAHRGPLDRHAWRVHRPQARRRARHRRIRQHRNGRPAEPQPHLRPSGRQNPSLAS